MSNFKDQELDKARFLAAKKDAEEKNGASAPQSKTGETSSLFSQPRNLAEQAQKPTFPTQTSTIDRMRAQKTSAFQTTPTRSPFDKPVTPTVPTRNPFDKPVTPTVPTRNPFDRPVTPTAPTRNYLDKPSSLTPTRSPFDRPVTPTSPTRTSFDRPVTSTPPTRTSFDRPVTPTTVSAAPSFNSVLANPNLSFKEKMQALQEKQAETRALLIASAKSASPLTSTVKSSVTPVSTFAERKPAPLFAERKPAPLFAERKPAPLFAAARAQNNSPITAPSASVMPTQFRTDYKISSEEFGLLRDFLYAQSGIFIAENRKYLMENRLSSRLRELGLHSFSEYHNFLRFDHNRMAELNKLFENMTTNETSFFRNNPQLDIFKDKVLARIIEEQRQKGQKKIHIWSAGCSSGEEPYTIAIILHEFLKNELSNWNIKITANDLSPAMLATAKKGLYSEYALRTTPPEIINKYFTKEEKLFKILPSVQKLVNFEQINLANSAQLAKVEQSHIVFCRNVIIYFDDEMKRHVINAFYDNLLPNGCLLIGHSESLHNVSRTFVPEHFTGAIVYGKKN